MSEGVQRGSSSEDAYLDALEAENVHIIHEAYATLERLALLLSLGKDSNVVIWLCRKAFFGHVPFPVAHVDTGRPFSEMQAFRERQEAAWNLSLITAPCPPVSTVDASLPPPARLSTRKTAGLKALIGAHGFTGILAGIGRDEEGTQANERVFSPRGSIGVGDFAVSRQSPGISTAVLSQPAAMCASTPCCTGRRSISGVKRRGEHPLDFLLLRHGP